MSSAPTSPSPRLPLRSKPRHLIARGDDAGLTPCVNEAMLEAAEHGILRNISILPNAPATAHAVKLLQEKPHIALGLHATITCEWETPVWKAFSPVGSVAGLLDAEGRLPRTVAEAQSRLTPENALREVAAQLSHLRALGAPIRYIDDHMAFTWLPGFKDALFHFCTSEGLLFAPSEYNPLPPSDLPPADHVTSFVRRLEKMDTETGLHIFHPARDTDALRTFTMRGTDSRLMAAQRAADLALCTDPRVASALAELEISPVRYDEIFHVGQPTTCPAWPKVFIPQEQLA